MLREEKEKSMIKSSLSPFSFRNAIDDIPKVSFLLSHILIKVGEVLDVGEQGLYTIKSGDTMSQIAQTYGMTTQALLKLNTWLIDKGRVSFDQDKVLIETDASNLTNKDHVLKGDVNAKNILRDLNGGNDVLIGGNQSDYLEGGEDFDTYQANNGDTIMDTDHSGKVYLAGHLLTGGKAISGQTNQYEGNYGEIYTLDTASKTLTVTLGQERITIQNYHQQKKSLGIALGKEITVTLDDAKVNEGNTMSIGVHIDTTLSHDITFCMMTTQESASEGEDYTGFGEKGKPYSEVTIKAGESVGFVEIPILKDTLTEKDETFYIKNKNAA